MTIESISWIRYLAKKYLRYVYVILLALAVCFPFKPKHNTHNLIDQFHLPDIAYPISYVAIAVFFILLVSGFSVPSLTTKKVLIDEKARKIEGEGWSINLDYLDYRLTKRTLGGPINGRNIWSMSIQRPSRRTINLLLDFEQKKQFEDLIKG